jgi:hypothetical protein
MQRRIPDVSLADQLACAKRELSIRLKTYPKWVAHDQMTERAAKREIAGQTAIVHTLERLIEEEEKTHQPGLWPAVEQ